MSDLIKREDAIDVVKKNHYRLEGHGLTEELLIEQINAIPSADRPRGEWIDMGDFEQCSVCKGTHLKEFQSYYGKATWIKTPYCPSCGARMKGAEDE